MSPLSEPQMQAANTAPAIAGEIDVTLGVDAKYAPHAATVIASIIRHAPGARFRFIILHTGIDAALQGRVQQAAPGHRFVWSEITDADVPAMADVDHFSRAILFRLGLEKHAPADCHRLIYVDADVIIEDDIRQVWNADLKGNPVGAIIDCFVKPDEFAARWQLASGPNYFNSGFLLIDMDKVRAEHLFNKATDFVVAHGKEIYLADQDALNFAMWGRWTRLPNRWNAQRHMLVPSLLPEITLDRQLNGSKPALVHFTSAEKPWLKSAWHPYSWTYWSNLRRTPFFNEVAAQQGMDLKARAKLWLRYIRRPI